jgi:hypothetical protein
MHTRLVATRTEAGRERREALAQMAASRIGARKANQEKINKMPMSGIGREKSRSSAKFTFEHVRFILTQRKWTRTVKVESYLLI